MESLLMTLHEEAVGALCSLAWTAVSPWLCEASGGCCKWVVHRGLAVDPL